MDEYARKVIQKICDSLQKLNQDQFKQSKAVEALFQAIKNGFPDIVTGITKAHSGILLSSTDPEGSENMFACALEYRQEKAAQLCNYKVKYAGSR
ncbi:hypothetical protein SLEP1_g47789 [Rubroshorea leprosula]|uniref:Uncharacterized protein n=1 Tax=Rubroshorea leprosula TaxID=152421 RepID=A0AAV5LTX4_9ROSI|nr:hypothetical protein SLEP1_g47789 [Rubroshorea leprosula]